MGMVTRALRRSAETRGAQVFLGSRVKRVIVKGGKAVGVELDDGRTMYSRVVVSNADIKTSMLGLLDPDALPTQAKKSVESLKNMGCLLYTSDAADE